MKDPEKVKAYNKKYYQENREKEKARVEKYGKENPDKVKETSKRYYYKNREVLLHKVRMFRGFMWNGTYKSCLGMKIDVSTINLL